MKNIFTKVLMGVAVIASSLVPLNASAAGNATFSLGASTGSVVNGGSFTVNVYENGDAVNTITAKLDYDASKLQFNGMSCAASFSKIAESTGATCYTAPNTTVSGSQLVGVASFKALAGSGSATISMNAGSKIVGGNPATDIWNHAASAASVAMTTPATLPSNPANTGGGATTPTTPQNTSTASSNSTAKTPSTTKTADNNSTNQTSPTDAAKTDADNTSVLGTAKKNTTASTVASLQKNAVNNPTWLIVLAILVVLVGAGAIYAVRNPRQLVAAKSAALLALGSMVKKSASAPAKKAPTKKPATKETPAKKARVTKKS